MCLVSEMFEVHKFNDEKFLTNYGWKYSFVCRRCNLKPKRWQPYLYLSSIADDSASFGYGPRGKLYLVGHCMLQCMAVKLKKPYYYYTSYYI